MISLALHGLRGGLGRTALLAALGYALRELGERVLLVDMCPDNLLGLHFNLPLDQRDGWACAELQGRPFDEPLYEVLDGLCLMPFGEVAQHRLDNLCAYQQPGVWRTRQTVLAKHFDWLLFDLPHPVAAKATRGFDTDMRNPGGRGRDDQPRVARSAADRALRHAAGQPFRTCQQPAKRRADGVA